MIFEKDEDILINNNSSDEINACKIDIDILKKRNQYQDAKRKKLFKFNFVPLVGTMSIKYIIAADFNNRNTQKNGRNTQEDNRYFLPDIKDKTSYFYIDPESPKFFIKYEQNITAADDALNSAFIDCFAKAMQPIISDNDFTRITTGIKGSYKRTPNDANYTVWEYIKEQEESDNKIRDFISSCSHCDNIICDNIIENTEDKFLMTINGEFLKIKEDKDRKTVIEFAVQYIFFNMFDRIRRGNIIVNGSDLTHIDTQRHEEENDGFFFSLNEPTNKKKRKSFNVFFKFFCKDGKRVNLVEEALEKCSNINYDTFLYNYVRNCIYLKVTPEDALENLRIFLNRMVSFYKKQPEIKRAISSIKAKIGQTTKDTLFNDPCFKEQLERLDTLEKSFNNAAKDILNNFNNSAIKKNVLDADKNNGLKWLMDKYNIVRDKILKLSIENKLEPNIEIILPIEKNNGLFDCFKEKCIKTCVDAFGKMCCCTK